MDQKKEEFFEFCKYWRMPLSIISNDSLFWLNEKWEKLYKVSTSEEYTGCLFGVDINKWMKEKKNKRKKQDEWIDSLVKKRDFKKNIECQIWHYCVDFDINLQWLYWFKTYCFDWLIQWIASNSTCPDWKIKLNKHNIRMNKEWKNFADVIRNEPRFISKPIWWKHQEEWDLYCTNCIMFICNKWIISKAHNDHALMEKNESILELQSLTAKVLSDKNSVSKRRQYAIESSTFSQLLNESFIDEAIDPFIKTISKFKEQNRQIKERINYTKTKLSNSDIIKYNLTLSRYYFTGNEELLNEVWSTLEKTEKMKEDVDNSVNLFNQETKNNMLCSLEALKSYDFIFELEGIMSNHEYLFKLEKNVYARIVFNNKESDDYKIVSVSIQDKYDSEWYWKLEFEDSFYLGLTENNLIKIYSNKNSEKIGLIQIKAYLKFLL